MSDYETSVVTRNNKIDIEVRFRHGPPREFTILVNKDGLKITSGDGMIVRPNGGNQVIIDTE